MNMLNMVADLVRAQLGQFLGRLNQVTLARLIAGLQQAWSLFWPIAINRTRQQDEYR
jgi:hypothetical protein